MTADEGSLPKDLAKNLQAIRNHDVECQKRAAEIDEKLKIFIRSNKKLSENAAGSVNKEIMIHFVSFSAARQNQASFQPLVVQALFAEIERLSDEKIKLASDAYELVDKHIRRLDNDSAKMQASMHKKYLESGDSITDEAPDRKKKCVGRKDKKLKSTQDKWTLKDAVTPAFLETQPVVEMPVDPNEPTYCICHQVVDKNILTWMAVTLRQLLGFQTEVRQEVSYGEMVMCDNKHCPIEWFHFQCVGLSESPKGKWYCDQCSEQRKKKNGNK